MKWQEKIKFWRHSIHKTPNLKDAAACDVNLKYKFIHEIKNKKYAILDVNCATINIKY